MPYGECAGRMQIQVISLRGAPNGSFWTTGGTTSPYIKLTLHDGTLSEDSWFPGWNEVERTTGKVHNDGYVEFNEHFRLNKPENLRFLRVGLEDPTMSGNDKQLGLLDIELDAVLSEDRDAWVTKEAHVCCKGSETAVVLLKLKIDL